MICVAMHHTVEHSCVLGDGEDVEKEYRMTRTVTCLLNWRKLLNFVDKIKPDNARPTQSIKMGDQWRRGSKWIV